MEQKQTMQEIREKFDLRNDNGHDHDLTNLDVQMIFVEVDKLIEGLRFVHDRAKIAREEEDEWGWLQELKTIQQRTNEILKSIGESEERA